ncbi:MAG: NTP transferase domain-containing protein [Lentisphaerae bacterium]|nr:NTP transferase domain-containing protein [Lentisphaerota bacterium]
MNPESYAVILAGGQGERFWPLSTRARPKQLLALVGRRALLVEAVRRVRPIIPPRRILVITAEHLREAVQRLLPGLPKENIVGEPCGRNTAAAITLGAALIKARNPQAVFCVLTGDHLIDDLKVFHGTLRDAFRRAHEADVLLTIGLLPSFPSTGFGYIEAGERLAGKTRTVFYKVRRFVEKPDGRHAAAYIRTGRFYWNSGMFVWSLAAWERALKRYRPVLARALARLTPLVGRSGFQAGLKRIYTPLESISVDYAIMEKADNIAMAEGLFAWDDVGAWSALARHLPQDARGNVAIGPTELMEAAGNIVVADGGLVALMGVENLVVVKAGSAVLVCGKERSEDVKRLVAQLRRRRVARQWL